jgi:transposase
MRKSWNGLTALAGGIMGQDPFSEALFAFCGRKKDLVKILYWDGNGFCIWQKRLEKGNFPWPQSQEAVLEMDRRQLLWLLSGVDFRKSHRVLNYSHAI